MRFKMGSIFKSRAQCARIAEKQCYLEKKTGGNVTCQILEDGVGEYEQMKHKKAKKKQQYNIPFPLTLVQGFKPHEGA